MDDKKKDYRRDYFIYSDDDFVISNDDNSSTDPTIQKRNSDKSDNLTKKDEE